METEKYDIARVELRSRKIIHVVIKYLSDDSFEFDLSNNKIKLYEINRISFIKNN